jgi:hypothetical protein
VIAEADRLPELPTTRHRDYILTSYEPRCEPHGRLHAGSLLKHLLAKHGVDAWPVIEALWKHLGRDETVWGAKWGPNGFAVELYFYNFVENAPGNPASATALADALRPFVTIEGAVDERLPYFMCSFELSADALESRQCAPFRIYLRSGDRHRRECGFSYRAESSERYVLENHYWFYRAAHDAELEDAILRVRASPRSGGKRCWPVLLPAALRDCFTICYAVKPEWDGLYYSRISTTQLIPFLSRHGQGDLAALLHAHADDFAHVSWDLGFDFRAPPGADEIAIPKLAVHAVI